MRKLGSMIMCLVLFLSMACCVKPPQSALTKEQISRLEEKFYAAMKEEDFLWGDAPKYIPSVLVENDGFLMKASFDAMSKQKGLHFDLAPGDSSLSIGNYVFKNNFSSIYYGISNTELDLFRNAEQVRWYTKNGLEGWFSAFGSMGSGINITLMFLLDEDTACFVMVDMPNESELTDELMQKMIDDFSCISF